MSAPVGEQVDLSQSEAMKVGSQANAKDVVKKNKPKKAKEEKLPVYKNLTEHMKALDQSLPDPEQVAQYQKIKRIEGIFRIAIGIGLVVLGVVIPLVLASTGAGAGLAMGWGFAALAMAGAGGYISGTGWNCHDEIDHLNRGIEEMDKRAPRILDDFSKKRITYNDASDPLRGSGKVITTKDEFNEYRSMYHLNQQLVDFHRRKKHAQDYLDALEEKKGKTHDAAELARMNQEATEIQTFMQQILERIKEAEEKLEAYRAA